MSICVWNKSSDEVSVWVTAKTNQNGSTSWWTLPPSSWDYWSRQGPETVTIYRHGYGPQVYETMVGNPGGNAIIYDPPNSNFITVKNLSGTMAHVKMAGGRPDEWFVALPPSQSRRWKRDGNQTVTIYRPGYPLETMTGIPGNTLDINSPSSVMNNIIVKNDSNYDMWVKVSNDSNPLAISSFQLVRPGDQNPYPRASSELVFAATTTQSQAMKVETRLGFPGGQTVVFVRSPSSTRPLIPNGTYRFRGRVDNTYLDCANDGTVTLQPSNPGQSQQVSQLFLI
ncbi:hypothetical protein BYT27DRAFT_6734077 [Phlegmacium glaucopus]|nr:hypothetical protein BYT27DRAFT_6734077 [Phlegmacium glaucopus]